MTTSLPELDRRLSKRIESGRSIQLSPADLDLWVSTGAYDTFRKAVAEHQKSQCRERSARSRSINGPGAIPKAPDTIQNADANVALQQVREMFGKSR